MSVSYALPKGGSTTQAVRVNMWCSVLDHVPIKACSGEDNDTDDQDDLAFTVIHLPASVPSAAPSTNPSITLKPSTSTFPSTSANPTSASIISR